MKIVIICSGSQGDVQPCLALALGLIKRGHSIVLVCNRRYKHLVSSYGVRWSQLSGDPQALLSSPEGQKWLANGDVTKFFSMMTDMLKQNWDNIVQDLDAACSTAECIITTQLGVSAAYCMAEKYGIPIFGFFLVPCTITSGFPSPLLLERFPKLGLFNKLTHFLVLASSWGSLKSLVNPWRQRIGLPPISNTFGVLPLFRYQGLPIIYGISPQVLKRPSDWTWFSTKITGFLSLPPKPKEPPVPRNWHFPQSDLPPAANTSRKNLWDFPVVIEKDEEYYNEEEKEEAQRSEELPRLEKFLDEAEIQNKPVVYMGFGSMPAPDPQKLVDLAIQVAKKVDKRVVLCAGWTVIDKKSLPTNVCMVTWAPHQTLFPRCECVVHHGGAGTTGAVLHAGVPSVICPVFADQPYWGKIVEDLGVGASPIPFKDLTAEKLAEAITAACKSNVKKAAKEFSKKLAEEDGLGKACETVERSAVISIGSVPTKQFAALTTSQVLLLELSVIEKGILVTLLVVLFALFCALLVNWLF